MSYTGKLKFILLLSHFEVDNFTANIDKDIFNTVFSMS